MPRAFRTCLIVSLLMLLASAVCLGVWFAGSLVFGLPTTSEMLGAPTSDLSQPQEVVLSVYLMLNRSRLDEPAGDPRMVWTIEVQPGDSAQRVIDQMTTIGLLDKPFLFRSYMRYLGLDRGIEAGMYDLSGSMTIRQLGEALQSARIQAYILTIPEGWRMEQIASQIEASEITMTADAFMQAASSPLDQYALSFTLPTENSLEGFLFPDTYIIEPEMSAEELVAAMLTNFDTRVDDSLRLAIADQGLSLYDAVVLASIVEREAILPEERPRIAAVFLNRLAIGMNLDADPTVQYALAPNQEDGWWPQLSLADLQVDSPYNTYRYPGLPPGPIASPGLDSIRAVAFPATSTEFYFRALCDGSGGHAFAETFEQHQLNSCP